MVTLCCQRDWGWALFSILLVMGHGCSGGRGKRIPPKDAEVATTGSAPSSIGGAGGTVALDAASGVDAAAGANGDVSSGGGIPQDAAGEAWGGHDAAAGTACVPGVRWCEGNTAVSCATNGMSQVEAACTGEKPLCRDGVCAACAGAGGPSMVAVGSFCIDSTEVTQAQYHAWLALRPDSAQQPVECAWNTSFEPPMTCTLDSTVCPWELESCRSSPQVCVDWCDARAFCLAVGKRLCGGLTSGSTPYENPSAGQWRMACRDVFPYGDVYQGKACNPGATSVAGAVTVASFPDCVAMHGGHAVYDLSGNAREWEDSCSARIGASDTCHARGGSFLDDAHQLTCESRPKPALRRDKMAADLGFRCCSP